MSKNWIEFPRTEGETSKQAHADLPAGTFEREIGRDGFFGPAAHIYHRHAPTGWTSFERTVRSGAAAEQCALPDFDLASQRSHAASDAQCRRRSVALRA
jgi:hypothetical protein